MSYNAPHGPLQATDDDLAKFSHINDAKRRTYAAMMFALDRGVGRLREFLKESGQLEETLIVFFSDNGGATGNASWNGPLSGAKGCLKEGVCTRADDLVLADCVTKGNSTRCTGFQS